MAHLGAPRGKTQPDREAAVLGAHLPRDPSCPDAVARPNVLRKRLPGGDGEALSSDTPRVSVVVPNYNYARYLEERFVSILAQSFGDREIIFIDDASTDD